MTARQKQTRRRIIEIIRGNPQISYDRLAGHLETDRRVVIRHIYALECSGHIRVERGRGKVPNRYHLIS